MYINGEITRLNIIHPAERRTAWVSDGVLRITALKEPMEGRSYTSAHLITKGKEDWLYGRF